MANEVKIKVKSTDATDFGGIKTKAKAEGTKAGDEAGRSFGDRVKGWFRRSGDDSSKSFGSSLKRWFKGDGAGLFTQIGKSGGALIGSAIPDALKTPILGPAILAVVGGVVATVMPAIGAIAGAGLVTGFGAGLAGLGIMFAAKSERVKTVWHDTLTQLGADMHLLARPFESTLIHIAGYFQRTVDKFNPALAKAFAKMAGPIDKFVDDAARSLEQLVPAIDPITNAFNGILDALGPALHQAIGELAGGMIDLANSVAKNPQALADVVRVLGDVVRQSLELIATLNDVNTKFSDMTGGLSLVEIALAGLLGPIIVLNASFSLMGKILDGVNALLGRTGRDVDGAGKAMSDAANQTVQLAQGLQQTGTAAQHGATGVKTVAQAAEDAKKKAAEAREKFERFISTLFRLQNQSLTLSGAQIGLQAAIDAASQSVKNNGKSLDINTEKGRNNRSALDALARSANDQTEAMIRAGKGNYAAATAAGRSRDSFVRFAMQMGLNKNQAQALARQLIAIPNVTREARLTANKNDLEAKLARARAALNDKTLTRERRARLTADIARLRAAIDAAQRKINALHGKTVVIQYTSKGVNLTAPSSVGRNWAGGPVMRGYAGGGNPPSSKEFVTGEYGPEILSISGGSVARVTPHGDSMRRLQQYAGGAQKVVLEIVAGDSSRYTQFLITELRKAIQIKGGNVQGVLGS